MKKLAVLLLAFALLCGCSSTNGVEVAQVVEVDNEEFEQWCTDLFVEEMGRDYLFNHKLMNQASEYEIETPVVQWETVNISSYNNYASILQGYRDQLDGFDINSLSSKQKATYENLVLNLDCRIYFYQHPEFKDTFFGNNSVVNMVVSELSDFNIVTIDDLNDYMTLIGDTDRYFYECYELLAYQNSIGYGLNDSQLIEAMRELNEFTDSEENTLTLLFESKLKQLDLSDEEKDNYRNYHASILNDELIPVLRDISYSMGTLMSYEEERTLCDYEGSDTYYEYLAHYMTSSNYTVDEIYQFMVSYLQTEVEAIRNVGKEIPEAYQAYTEYQFPIRSALEIMNLHLNQMGNYVPVIEGVNYNTLLTEQGEIGTSYRVPVIDRRDRDALQVNVENPASLYVSLAHEGFPGHVYLNLYTDNLDLNPVHYWLTLSGYEEGWASYVQLYSYEWEGMDQQIAKFYRYSTIESYILAALIDIAVNYYGASSEDMTNELNSILNLSLKERKVKELMDNYGDCPGLYLAYGFGLAKMGDWKNALNDYVSSDGELMIPFNEVILKKGPRTFENIQSDMETFLHSFDE